MNHAVIRATCPLTPTVQGLLERAFRKFDLSARSYDRIIKVARTIADLAGTEDIAPEHLAEAIQLRSDAQLELGT